MKDYDYPEYGEDKDFMSFPKLNIVRVVASLFVIGIILLGIIGIIGTVWH